MKSLIVLALAVGAYANIVFTHATLTCNTTSPRIYHGCFRGQICKRGECITGFIADKPDKPKSVLRPGQSVGALEGTFSTDGRCGHNFGDNICDPNSSVYTGGCCSSAGWCGNSALHCTNGCISGCWPTPPVNPTDPRPDGTCGSNYGGAICDPKGLFGGCCSQYGFCGSTSDYCLKANGCQSGCFSDEPTIGPAPGGNGAGGATTDGTCGARNGNTVCGNWQNGNCCSVYGFCGNTDGHCGAGCQSGNCFGPPTSPAPGPSPAPADPRESYFVTIGESGVPAMHAALLPNGQSVFLDKLENYTQITLPNGRYAMSSEFDSRSGKAVPLAYKTNALCAGGAFLADGTLISIGGNGPLDWLDPTIGDGFDAIRFLRRSSSDSSLNGRSWDEPGFKLASKRWYPSVQTMPDGTIFVTSGSLNGLDPTKPENNNPTYEILNRDGTPRGINYPLEFLAKNQPYYMYPFVHLLKDGNLFLFTAKSAQLFNVPRNAVIRDLPGLPGDYRTYPNTGGSVLLPLTSRNGWEPEVLICGGGAYQAITSPTDASCGRIAPIVPGSTWEMDSMPEGRGGVEGTLLADGTVLWLNGGNRGAQGFEQMSNATQQALLYDPAKPKGQRWTTLATSPIARMYHSVAYLNQDGTVLVAGSNPIEMPKLQPDTNDPYPTEFRVETFVPPYLAGSQKYRASNVRPSSGTIRADGSHFQITFYNGGNGVEKIKVMLHHNGFVTHALHMGQRIIELDVIRGFVPHAPSGDVTIEVAGPPTNYVAPPGPYNIYVVVDGMPTEGAPVLVD